MPDGLSEVISEGISEGMSEGMSEISSGSDADGTAVSTDVGPGEMSAIGPVEEPWDGASDGTSETVIILGERVGREIGASVLTTTGLCVGGLVTGTGAITGLDGKGTSAFGEGAVEGAVEGADDGTSIGILVSLCNDLQMPLKSSSRMLSTSEISVAMAGLALFARRFLGAPPTVLESS